MARVSVDIGGPAQLDVKNARRGSRWYLPMTLTFVTADGLDANDITGATLWLKKSNSDDTADAVLAVTGTVTVASALSVLIEFEVAADDTPAIDAGAYAWDWELASTDERLDGWAPCSGSWRVVQRIYERGGS